MPAERITAAVRSALVNAWLAEHEVHHGAFEEEERRAPVA
jgi:hypothetical protein